MLLMVECIHNGFHSLNPEQLGGNNRFESQPSATARLISWLRIPQERPVQTKMPLAPVPLDTGASGIPAQIYGWGVGFRTPNFTSRV